LIGLKVNSTAAQDKHKEIAFFDRHAEADSCDVFTPESSLNLVRTCVDLAGFRPAERIADLDCGSGVFTEKPLLRGSNA
jgi:hypothetical protein